MSMTETEEATEAAGRSIEEEAENPTQQPEQLPIPGTRPELSLSAGGIAPESSAMKFRGGSVNVEGEFEKGQTIRVWAEITVTEVHFVDSTDEYGNVKGTTRRHIGRVRRITTGV